MVWFHGHRSLHLYKPESFPQHFIPTTYFYRFHFITILLYFFQASRGYVAKGFPKNLTLFLVFPQHSYCQTKYSLIDFNNKNKNNSKSQNCPVLTILNCSLLEANIFLSSVFRYLWFVFCSQSMNTFHIRGTDKLSTDTAAWGPQTYRIQNTFICCGLFQTGFCSSDRRQYSESLLWDMGATPMWIKRRPHP